MIVESRSNSTISIHLGSQLSALITAVEIVSIALTTAATLGWDGRTCLEGNGEPDSDAVAKGCRQDEFTFTEE